MRKVGVLVLSEDMWQTGTGGHGRELGSGRKRRFQRDFSGVRGTLKSRMEHLGSI